MSDSSQGPGWWQASDGQWYPPESAPQPLTPPPPPAPLAGNIAGPGVSKQRNWKKIGLIGAGVLVALIAVAALASPSEDESAATLDPDEQAIKDGNVALCDDGNYSDNTDFSATCSGGDGIDKWLAPFGECEDGTVIKMSDSATCGDNGGFKGLLPADFEPTPRENDIALCEDGTYSDNTDFSATCSSRGGVDEWLAPYGECKDGTVIVMSKEASCAGNSGFKGLLPQDYEPPGEETSTTAEAAEQVGNADLAALLAGPSTGPSVNAFSEKYRTEMVEFDAVVTDAYINPREHNGESWVRLMAGSAGDPQRSGPVFQLSWIGQDSDLKQYAVGTNVRVKALVGMVYGFEPYQLFLVEDENSSALTPR